jgi:heme/copper-type cytochrome/quinol oxidase subunit 3
MSLGVLVFLWNVVRSLRDGKMAGDNPWDAFTLEWATTSPPGKENFESVPPVKSRRPVWDVNHPELADWKTSRTPEDRRAPHSVAKLAAGCFIVSEAMFFVLLIAAFITFNHSTGATFRKALEVGRSALFTFFLLASSVTLSRAERALRRSQRRQFLRWLSITLVLGFIFLVNQALEYSRLLHNGVTISSSLFGSTFFTLTGFHGLHVLGGLIVLTAMFVLGKTDRLSAYRSDAFTAVGYYWHFVDIVWIVVFSVIYPGVLT